MSKYDVALYDYDVASGQSNARIVLGERICEGTLLRGLLVHSAGDYSQLLQSMIGWSPATFVRIMNADARTMGLTRTHYVDLTGISPGDQSTAAEQATLAVNLMDDEPVVDQIVALTHVSLPYNGVVESYTPFIGVANVVGVKSGFTDPAGGCDVMAVKVTIGANTFLTYAVVLGRTRVERARRRRHRRAHVVALPTGVDQTGQNADRRATGVDRSGRGREGLRSV